jgi:glyoxylase-like metal-dependent hydrolase (beta-lactamase superfamily II)
MMPNTIRLFVGITALALTATGIPVAAQQQQDFSKVEIVTTKIADNFYALDGQGGRIGILVGPEGVFMVDSQFAPLSEKITAAIKKVSNAPIRFLVNTHVHGDHTGGNENFGKMGVTIISRPLLRQRLAKPNPPAPGGNPVAPAPAVALPMITIDSRTTVYMNGQAIELIPLPGAHTDGDTAVRFPGLDILMTGDVFRSVGFPNIDRANGGTMKGMYEAYDTLIAAAGPNTKVLPGHGDITNRAAIVAHKEMAVAVRDRVAKMISQGQTQEQIVAAKPTKDFDEKTGNAAQSADRFVGQLYAEIRGAGTK